MTIQRGIVGCNSIKIINPSAKANSLYGNSLSARNLGENQVWLSSGSRRANSRLIIALCFEIIEIEKMRTASRTARLYLDLLTIARTCLMLIFSRADFLGSKSLSEFVHAKVEKLARSFRNQPRGKFADFRSFTMKFKEPPLHSALHLFASRAFARASSTPPKLPGWWPRSLVTEPPPARG